MRVLVTSHSVAAGGAERIIADITRWWVEDGHDVAVVTKLSETFDACRLHPKVERRSLGTRGLTTTPIGLVTAVRALRRHILSYVPDLVVGICSGHATLVAVATFGLSCKTIGCEFSAPSKDAVGVARSVLRWLAYARLDAVIAETRGTADWLNRHTPVGLASVIPKSVRWPIVDEIPSLRPGDHIEPGRRVVLAAGRLVPVKDHASLIRAFAMLAASQPQWDLVILGEGPLRADLESLVRALKVADRVFLPGHAGNISQWYGRASLFALSSLHEGGPNVLVEALAHGLPAVSVDCDMGPREIVRDGVDGVLVPPSDVPALANGLRSLMDDEARRLRMAAEALRARERFSESQAMAAWNELFTRVGVGNLQRRIS